MVELLITRKPRLFITREIFDEALRRLEDYYEYVIWDKYQPPPYEVLKRVLQTMMRFSAWPQIGLIAL